jgi:acetyl esterase
MSSLTGLKVADGQRLSPRLAALCGGSTLALNFAARHPSDPVRAALDQVFGVVSLPYAQDAPSRDLQVDGGDGPIPARLYEPDTAGAKPGLLVYFHGGGWVLGSLTSHANAARFTAKRARCKILAVGYRKAPEHRFPAAFEDCRAAYRWAVAHADELGVDPERIAVGGDSAGGNLAASVALHLDDGEPKPCLAWLMYPLVDADVRAYRSAELFRAGPLLSTQAASDMVHNYAPSPRQQLDPRMSVIETDTPERMPRTYIATAGMDPLRDQGEAFGQKLREAGVETEIRRFDDVPHGFNLLLVDPDARTATEEAVAALERGLRGASTPAAVS